MSFQKTIAVTPAYAVEGDIASDNPRAALLNLPSLPLITGTAGAVVGRFAWVTEASQTVTNSGAGAPAGFISRHYQGVITQWLGNATMVIPAGINVAVHPRGDFWAKTATTATKGQKVFASNTVGRPLVLAASPNAATRAPISCPSTTMACQPNPLHRAR